MFLSFLLFNGKASESGIAKIRNVSKRPPDLRTVLTQESAELMEPFFMGCDTKVSKMVQISLNAIQKLIIFEAVSEVIKKIVHNFFDLMFDPLLSRRPIIC